MILAWLVLLSATTLGISLKDYQAKVANARGLATEVEKSLKSSELNHAETRAFVDYIKRNFPQSEPIDWAPGAVEASNAWLLEKNLAFERETDLKKRLPIIVEMREYLSTIDFKLQELESTAAAGRSKDEDKQKLAEILRREEYQKPQAKEETAFQRLIREFLEWLESLFRAPKQAEPVSGFGGLAAFVQVLFVIGVILLLGFLVFKLIPLIAPGMRRTRKPKKKERIILGEKIAENETAVDLFAEAERLAREGNLRGAIRKGYIALLCDLSDKKVLGLARHKTNRDYLRDVRARRELHPRMQVVTETFERHWYGFQESAEQDWTQFRDDYDRAIRSV